MRNQKFEKKPKLPLEYSWAEAISIYWTRLKVFAITTFVSLSLYILFLLLLRFSLLVATIGFSIALVIIIIDIGISLIKRHNFALVFTPSLTVILFLGITLALISLTLRPAFPEFIASPTTIKEATSTPIVAVAVSTPSSILTATVRIQEGDQGESIANAQVLIVPQTTIPLPEVRTDANGLATIDIPIALENEQVTLFILADGYKTYQEQISVDANNLPSVISLEPLELAMTPSPIIVDIFSRGFFIAAIRSDLPPLAYNNAGNPQGFEVDIMREFARRWFEDENAFLDHFIYVDTKERLPIITSHQADIVIGALSITPQSDEIINFSIPYFEDGQKLLVQNASGINNHCDLEDKKLAVIKGTTGVNNIKGLTEACGFTIDNVLIEYPSLDIAVQALRDGIVDAVTADSVLLQQYEDNSLGVTGPFLSNERYGIGLPEGDEDLQETIDLTLQAMVDDGTYDAIFCKWFGTTERLIYPIEFSPEDLEGLDGDTQELITTELDPLYNVSTVCNVQPTPTSTSTPSDDAEPSEPTSSDDAEPSEPTPSDDAEPSEPTLSKPEPEELPYTVQAGDTLYGIAATFCGAGSQWEYIYNYGDNKAVIGDDPIGGLRQEMELIISCQN